MGQILIGCILIIAGGALIVLREKFVETIMRANNEDGLGFRHYEARDKELGLKLTPFFGTLFVIVGILILIGVIEFK